MPPVPGRRIIYIKNPSQGSHFRTISSSGGSFNTVLNKIIGKSTGDANKEPRPLPGTGPVQPGFYANPRGYLPNRTAPGSWAINNPEDEDTDNPWLSPYANSEPLPGYGVGPYEQEFTPPWEEPESLAGQLLIIAQGYDPATGEPSPRFGEPGYHTYNFLSGKHKMPFGNAQPAQILQRRPLWYPFD